jgi:hypothetical protein
MARLNQPVDNMFRAGQISSKQVKRLSAQHGWSPGKGAKTKGQMAPFHGKGTKDQGGVHGNKGILDEDQIDQPRHQRTGAAFKPSKGGGAGRETSPAPHNGIDMPMQQKPDWPRGSGATGKAGGAPKRLSAQTGPIPRSGPLYGGPSSRKDG